jgi:uncharacterized repeat protein (TIGR01451 family)
MEVLTGTNVIPTTYQGLTAADGSFTFFVYLPPQIDPYTVRFSAAKSPYEFIPKYEVFSVSSGAAFELSRPFVLKVTDLETSITDRYNYALPGWGDPAAITHTPPISYKIAITNTGNLSTTNLVLTTTWSTDLTFLRADQLPQGLITQTRTTESLNWVYPLTVAPSHGISVTLYYQVNLTTTIGSTGASIKADVSSNKSEINKSNNTTTDLNNYTMISGGVWDVSRGLPLSGVVVRLTDASGRVFSNEPFKTGATGKYNFISTVDHPIASGPISITASRPPDYEPSYANHLSIRPGQQIQHNLYLLPAANPFVSETLTFPYANTVIAPGQILNYSFGLGNNGLLDARDVTITSTLSPWLEFMSTSGDLGYGDTHTWSINVIPAGKKLLIQTMRAKVKDPLPLQNGATFEITHTIKVRTGYSDAVMQDNSAEYVHKVGQVGGLVVDEKDQPIIGASVLFIGSNGQKYRQKTSQYGMYSFNFTLPTSFDGPVELHISKPGYLSEEVVFVVDPDVITQQDITLFHAPYNVNLPIIYNQSVGR